MKRLLPLSNLVILITAAILATGVASGQTPLPELSKDGGTVTPDSITLSVAQKIKLYPVPVISDLFIDNIVNVTRIEIFDVMGNKHISETCDNQDHLRIPVSQLPRGIYFIRFITPGSTSIKRFTKE
ncbi:MAG: T9SS type A sorting domain-containing protein [Bacteroidales bacterium]